MESFLKVLLYGLQFLAGIILIVLVVMQTSKSEGLGVVGGGSSPSLRGRAGMEEKLSEYTRYAAGFFMFISLMLFLAASKFHWS